MIDIYNNCPTFENEAFKIRLIDENDTEDLLLVYSDKQAVKYFNSDNCHGDNFHYDTLEVMKQAMNFWIDSYYKKYFVRLSIIDKKTTCVIGTIEVFKRDIDKTCLLRLDLRSDYEKEDVICCIMDLIMNDLYELFEVCTITTKYFEKDSIRKKAFERLKFNRFDITITGNDLTIYKEYCLKYK